MSTQIETDDSGRSIFTRIVFSLLWLLPILIIGNALVGGVIGAMVATTTEPVDFETAQALGAQAATEFFGSHGHIVFSIEMLLWLALSLFGILPGTGRGARSSAAPTPATAPGSHVEDL